MASLLARDQFRPIESEGVADPSSQSLLLQVIVLCNPLYKTGPAPLPSPLGFYPYYAFFVVFIVKTHVIADLNCSKSVHTHLFLWPFQHRCSGSDDHRFLSSVEGENKHKKVALVACVISAEVTFFHHTRRESYYQLTYCVT